MLRLIVDREPRWIDLACGVRLQVEPLTAVTFSLAGDAVRRRFPTAAEDQEDPASAETRFVALTEEVAARVVTAWQGVGDADGAPMPFTPEGLTALMQLTTVNREFGAAVVVPHLLLLDEKKGSAPLRTGTSPATAPDTAAGASPSVPPAPTG